MEIIFVFAGVTLFIISFIITLKPFEDTYKYWGWFIALSFLCAPLSMTGYLWHWSGNIDLPPSWEYSFEYYSDGKVIDEHNDSEVTNRIIKWINSEGEEQNYMEVSFNGKRYFFELDSSVAVGNYNWPWWDNKEDAFGAK